MPAPLATALPWASDRLELGAGSDNLVFGNDASTPMVSIRLNGAPYVCRSPSPRVADLVRELALEGKRVAVEQNGQIVPRSRHAETALCAGDRIEVVGAVGGG